MTDQQSSNQKQFEGSGGELKWAMSPMAQKPRVNPENNIFICMNIYPIWLICLVVNPAWLRNFLEKRLRADFGKYISSDAPKEPIGPNSQV